MKKIVLAACIIIAMKAIQANNNSKLPYYIYQTDKTKERVDKMDQVVGLTAEQKVKYKALLEDNDKKKIEFQNKVKDKPLEERKKMQVEFKKDFEKDLKAILTAEQWKKMEAERAKNQSKNN